MRFFLMWASCDSYAPRLTWIRGEDGGEEVGIGSVIVTWLGSVNLKMTTTI